MNKFSDLVEGICKKDKRYKPDAYEFVLQGLNFTQDKLKNRQGHICGSELARGLRDYAINQYGALALRVLNHWGISQTRDFGNIVFNLVKNHVLSKTENDNIESFRRGYDFQKAFHEGYRQQLAKRISRMRTM